MMKYEMNVVLFYVKVDLMIQVSSVVEAPKAPTLRKGFSLSTADFGRRDREGHFLRKECGNGRFHALRYFFWLVIP